MSMACHARLLKIANLKDKSEILYNLRFLGVYRKQLAADRSDALPDCCRVLR
jgi:hypothetical protein